MKEESFIYFASRFNDGWKDFTNLREYRIRCNGYTEQEARESQAFYSVIKIGETASLRYRTKNLYYKDHMNIRRLVCFNGTKDERLFIEAYLRSKYASNRNMRHFGNDHFRCSNSKILKGAENKFFQYVAEAFALLEQVKKKEYSYECLTL